MKLLSYNVNGLTARVNKERVAAPPDLGFGGGGGAFFGMCADIAALQEIKVNAPVLGFAPPGYRVEWSFAERPGYAGTACLFRKKPLAVTRGIGNERFDRDGRIITLEYPAFLFVNVYVPNSQGGLAKWYHRLEWDEAFYGYAAELLRRKPVVIGGDFNVAHEAIDTYHTGHTAGFREEERGGFDRLLSLGLVDAFRLLNPDARAYTWWSGKNGNRAANRGRRLDYFLVSENISGKVKSADILCGIQGGDHVPIALEIDL